MTSSIHPYTNPQLLPNRLPKLSYRTRSCETESVSSASTGFSRSTSSTTPTSPLRSDFCPSPRSPPSEMSLPFSPRQSTFAPSTRSPGSSSTVPKKQSNFFSSLFSVKEPSAQALQDYQRQLMKQGGGRVTAVGIPGVSSAKLPATVPKVNSKWDGVPQIVKEKEKQQDTARLCTSKSEGSQHRATSAADSSRRRLSRGTLGGVSVQSSSSNHLAELYGWETSSYQSGSSATDFAAEHRPSTSRTTSSWSAPSLQPNSSFPSRDTSQPSATPPTPTDLPLPSCCGSPDLPALSYSPMLTPYDSSPATPDAPSPFTGLAPPLSEAVSHEKNMTTLLGVPGSAGEVIVKSAGVNILGPPAVAKRKPRPSPLQSSDQRPNTSGGGVQLNSILRREAPIQKDTPSPRPLPNSYFPTTITTPNSDPSIKVLNRRNSTRERPGLGMNLKNQMAAPWQLPEQSTAVNAKDERIVTPTPEGGQAAKRKSRMTLFKK